MDTINTPSIGTRFVLNNDIGTIKYIGPVDGTQGIWLGVEWDNPNRGKHDGLKDGKRYFSCRFETAGSFIRLTAHVLFGVSFLEALNAKYIETLHGSDREETVTLGSSQGAIQVTAVSLDKIREKFSRLDRLREVSLDGAIVVRGDPPGDIAKTCPNIRGLDLSQNLLPTWKVVAQITQELLLLERLSLNRNRLQMPLTVKFLSTAFMKLVEIQLNDTLITWLDMQKITSFMPQLRVIEMGYNRLTRLCGDKAFYPLHDSTVEYLNLDTNMCSDWVHICASLEGYKLLQRVVLTSNKIENIPFPKNISDCLLGIKYLALSGNHISSWESIDALSCWFPSLETLTMSGNPIMMNNNEFEMQSRPFLIARVPTLMTLDGASISPRERIDSELFYLSSIIQQGPAEDGVRAKSHYHWLDLCKKHGKPDEMQTKKNTHDKLSNHLIGPPLPIFKLVYRIDDSPVHTELNIHQYDSSMEEGGEAFQMTPKSVLRVLPTMTLRILRMKTCKALKCEARKTNIVLWLYLGNKTLTLLDQQQDLKDLDWLGVENGSHIAYQVK